MSRRLLARAAFGLAAAGSVLLVVAGPATADDSTRGPDGAGGGSSNFTGDDPSPANDVTPGGVPIHGLLDSVKSAPKKILPDAAGQGY